MVKQVKQEAPTVPAPVAAPTPASSASASSNSRRSKRGLGGDGDPDNDSNHDAPWCSPTLLPKKHRAQPPPVLK